MGLMLRTKAGLTDGAGITVSAAAGTWGVCQADEVAIFVGSSVTARRKGLQVQDVLYRAAEAVARKPTAPPSVAATGTITLGTAVAGDRVTVQGVNFDLVASNPTGDQVLIGATAAETMENLLLRLRANSTTAPLFWVTRATNVITLTAKLRGTAGNAYTLAETGTSFTISGANLSGGLDYTRLVVANPEGAGFTATSPTGATAVTETYVALVIGDQMYTQVKNSAKFLNTVEQLLERYKRSYGVKA